MPSRTLVTARLRPMDRPGSAADWMLVADGQIEAVGRGAPAETLAEGASVLDLRPRTVLPGLHDAHVHFLSTGLMETDVDLSSASRFDDVLALLESALRDFEGTILRAHSFDPDLLPDGRYPTAADLDALSSDVPIYVRRRDGHSSIVNSRAAELLALSADTPGVETEGGRPTGILRGRAHGLASRRVDAFVSDGEKREAYRRAARRAAERGIAVVHALVGSRDPANRDVEILLDVEDELPVDVVVFAQTEDVDRVAALGLPRIGGCLLLDGSFSSGTAALAEPYADRPGCGNLYYTDDGLTGFFRRAHARGLQIAVHALGELAIAQAIRCLRGAAGDEVGGGRHRIEHCELPTADHLDDLARLGVLVSVQPTFELFWGGPGRMYEKRLGSARAARTNPFRTMLARGVKLAGGSDSYVTPMDSLLGIHAAVNRPNESERLDVFDAVSLFTSGASCFSFDEARRGTLEAGKEASFVVLDEDPFEVDPATIKDIGVFALYVRGEPVFERAPSPVKKAA